MVVVAAAAVEDTDVGVVVVGNRQTLSDLFPLSVLVSFLHSAGVCTFGPWKMRWRWGPVSFMRSILISIPFLFGAANSLTKMNFTINHFSSTFDDCSVGSYMKSKVGSIYCDQRINIKLKWTSSTDGIG